MNVQPDYILEEKGQSIRALHMHTLKSFKINASYLLANQINILIFKYKFTYIFQIRSVSLNKKKKKELKF